MKIDIKTVFAALAAAFSVLASVLASQDDHSS